MIFLLRPWWIARRQNNLKVPRVVGDQVVSITFYMYLCKGVQYRVSFFLHPNFSCSI